MNTIFDKAVKTIPEAIEVMLAFARLQPRKSKDDEPYLWFRGVRCCTMMLQPGAHWRTNYKERQPLVEFVQRGSQYPDSVEMQKWSSWGTYYLAQHYGIPTRLLDWSESFASALFFAFDGAKPGVWPCIWILSPNDLNQASCNYEGILSPEHNPELDIYLPDSIGKHIKKKSKEDKSVLYDNNIPLAIFPKQANRRILSQSGFFTVGGRKKEGLEIIIPKICKSPKRTLLRLKFEDCDISRLKEELGIMGIRRSGIYPDLANFVGELQEIYKW
jgi:hypothetical protein